jgi:hypothetical protein
VGAKNKAVITIFVILVTGVLVLWQGSPLRPDFVYIVLGLAGVSLLVLWLFPEGRVHG